MENDHFRELVTDVASFTHDPYGHARYAYPWGEGVLKGESGPRDWQRDTMNIIRDHLSDPATRYEPCRIAVASGHGIGKAQRLDCLIDTPAGARQWGDLLPGDLVFAANGKPTRIVSCQNYDSAPMYRVKFDDGTSCDVSSGHLWNVRGRHERRNNLAGWRTMETIEILTAGLKRLNGIATASLWEIPRQMTAQYPAVDVALDPYILGIWLGDVGRNSARITGIDDCMLQSIADRGYSFSMGDKSGAKAESVHIHGLAALLRKIGLLDKYSYEKSIPRDYMENDTACRADVLRGLLDAGGECAKHGSIIFSSCSKQLTDDVVWLARSFGGKARICPTVKQPAFKGLDGKKKAGRPCHRAVLAMPHKFQSFSIERKQARVHDVQERYLSRWIESIEPIGDMQCMCITVDSIDGLYQANDFIVTHNSAEIAMLVKWALDTCEDTRIVFTANTEAQLLTKTMPEITKWSNMAITSDWFKPTATALISTAKGHDKGWRADAVTWSINNTEAFAGLHNKSKRIVVIYDEASGIAAKVWEVTLGALTDENTEIIWLAFGNPTLNTGSFRDCFGKFRNMWKTRQIDSRAVEGTNKAYLDELVKTYGLDSDIVRVRVLGQFPSASSMQFIGNDLADGARNRDQPESLRTEPVIFGVDCARFGDDHSTLAIRCGRDAVSRPWKRWHQQDSMLLAGDIAMQTEIYKPDAIFVDAGNIGGGVIDRLRQLGVPNVHEVWFGSTKVRQARWNDVTCNVANKRAEMWSNMRSWLETGVIPRDQQLFDDLVGPEYGFNADQAVLLEKKEHMKARGLSSPDDGDALACTFAEPVLPRALPAHMNPDSHRKPVDNNIYAELDQ